MYAFSLRIGNKAGVSETTVIRFCHAVGFESFIHMQRAVWEEELTSNYTLQLHQQTGNEGDASGDHANIFSPA